MTEGEIRKALSDVTGRVSTVEKVIGKVAKIWQKVSPLIKFVIPASIRADIDEVFALVNEFGPLVETVAQDVTEGLGGAAANDNAVSGAAGSGG